MLKFLKDLMKKGEEAPRFLTFEELGEWLDEEEKREKADLEVRTEAARSRIDALRRSLSAQAGDLTFPEEKRQLHPKLERIAISTLPLFERSMGQTLGKPFPSGTDEFYAAAAECLKSCLKAVQGQGKYLQAVFPEEMKAIRATLRDFGNEINALTGAMKMYRERSAQVREVRRVYDALIEIRDGHTGAGSRRSQIERRIADARKTMQDLKREQARLESGPEFRSLTAIREQISRLERDQDRTTREFTVLSAALAHVFRKAEKVAGRKGDPAAAKAVRQATDMLSDHQVPSRDDLAAALRSSLPVVMPLIESGEVPLKNREERVLFADPDHLTVVLEQSAAEYHACAKKLTAALEELAANPVAAHLTQIETESRQMEKTIARGEAQLGEFAKHLEDAAGAVPTLIDELERTAAALSGGKVRVQTGPLISMMEKREKSV
jgi:hypothetical protein